MLNMDLDVNRRRGGAPLSPEAQVAAYLAGSKGAYLDLSAAAQLEQSAGVPVVNPSDPVGRLTSLYGTTVYQYTQAGPQRGLWTGAGGGVDFDGTDDTLNLDPSGQFRNVGCYLACISFKPEGLSGTRVPFYFSQGDAGGTARFAFRLLSTGGAQISYSRADADAETTIALSAGTFVVGTQYTVFSRIGLITSTSEVRINGVQVANPAVTGSANSSDTDGIRGLIAQSHTGQRFNGVIGRIVFGVTEPTADQRTAIEALVGGVTL